MSESDYCDALDPRVQIELERLNTSTDEINRLELSLDEARLVFKQLLVESNIKIQQLAKKYGSSVQKSRPYYEARYRANIAAKELETASRQYEKANSAHLAAKEMMFLAEQGLNQLCTDQHGPGVTLDQAWQEMLNHATEKVNQAESERTAALAVQRSKSAAARSTSALVLQLQHSLKRHIAKSRPYFEEKARINSRLDTQKSTIVSLEREVSIAKLNYSEALRNLENISDEIHRHRSSEASSRNSCSDVPKLNGSKDEKPNPYARNKNDKVRKWLQNSKNNDQSPNESENSLSRPSSLPQDFEDGYSNLLSPIPKANDTTPSIEKSRDSENWTEINLEYSSPEEVSFEKCSNFSKISSGNTSPDSEKLMSRVSTGSPRRIIKPKFKMETASSSEACRGSDDSSLCRKDSLRSKLRPDLSTWMNRARDAERRQSLDVIINDKAERFKEIFSQGIHMFNISLSERRNSEPKLSQLSPTTSCVDVARLSLESRHSTVPSPSFGLYRDDNPQSLEMLTDDQIHSIMLDGQLEAMCHQLLGTTLQINSG